jgi:hypothetical protein
MARRRIRAPVGVVTVAPPDPPTLRAGATSGSATGLSAVVTLPARQAGDVLTLIVSSNQAPTLGFSAGVDSFTLRANASGRLQAIRVVPAAGATTVTLTASVSAVLTWWCGAWQNVAAAAAVPAAANNLGNSTTAAIEVPVADLGFISTGYEVLVRAAGVNSTATWGTHPDRVHATTSGNAALAVRVSRLAAGQLAAYATPFDRGNEGVSRNESALAFVLQPAQTPTVNLLANGSFEAGGGAVATGWEIEGTAPRPATCSRAAIGVVDGAVAQRFQFTGQAGDSGNIAIYQAPIPCTPGQTFRATIHLSGTLTNAYAIFGIEGFVTAGGAYISEHDTVIDAGALTGTPVEYSVEYTAPANATALAVYFQVPTVAPATIVDVYLDRAVLARI